MLVWTFTGQKDACMDSYWVDCCKYGQLLDRPMQVQTVTGQTNVGMGIYWIQCSRYGVTGWTDAGKTVTGQKDAGMDSDWID